MSRFLEHATRLMEAAEEAVQAGHGVSEVTVLIHQGGGLHLLMQNDWPLDSLILDRGADIAYRVSGKGGAIRVQGKSRNCNCVLESKSPERVARQLLGPSLQ